MGLALLAAGCAAPDRVKIVDEGPVVLPSGEARLVASYTVDDGPLILPAYQLISPPELLVFSDGRVIADARRTLTLSAAELSDLVRSLRRDLSGLEGSIRSRDQELIMDAATSVIKVLAPDLSLKKVSAYALGDGHPAGLLAARDRLRSLADRAARNGAVFTTDRVRLVAYPYRDYAAVTGDITAWPATVDFPPAANEASEGARWADHTGEPAKVVAATMPGGPDEELFTRVIQAPGGEEYRVSWRYLTPEE